MVKIQREWLRRIPEYHQGVSKPRKGYRPDESGESAMRPDDDGDPTLADDDGQADAADPSEDDSAEKKGDAAPDEDGTPRDSAAGDSADGPADDPTNDGDGAPPLDTSLTIPDDIADARDEAERRKERTPWNRHGAPRAFPLEGRYLRGLATRFARMVSKLAEDNADLPQEGDDEWDINALVRRRFSGKLPNQCRMSREKRKVVVVLDTSPSCAHQARLFGSVAQIAEELGDCEMYDAPNFALHSRWEDGEWVALPTEERGWAFRNRVVLAFGDFDGIDHICEASRVRGNRIYWFSCEERPQVLERNRDLFVRNYRGHYHPAMNLDALMRAMGRVR